MEESEIRTRILKHFKDFSEELRKEIGENNPFKERYEKLIPDFKEFKYNKGGISYQMGSKIVKREKIDFIKIYFSFKEFNENNDKFEEIIDNLNKKYGIEINFLNRLFENLMYSLIDELLEPKADEKLVEKIQVLFNDLELKPSKCYVKAWIDGIWLSQEEYFLEENIKIRRITPEDIEYVQRADYYGGVTPLHKFIVPTTIIEVNLVPNISKESNIITNEKYLYFQGLMERELMIELDYISLALKLFRLGSVFIHKVERTSDSLIQKGKTIAGDFQRIKHKVNYGIKECDIPKINTILALIRKKKGRLFDQNKKLNPFIIALERFNNALLNAETSESSIMYIISCLEALFLKGSELSELSRRLNQRISIFLKPFGFNPLLISRILKQAYNIRSKYSHGSLVDFKKKKIENVRDFKIKVMECARISLLIYLQLVGNISKEDLLNLIDNSLLDDDSYIEFNKLIQDNCKIEILVPPDLIQKN
ncbi:hypothetical protein ES705_09005 [subsurface metagenome]